MTIQFSLSQSAPQAASVPCVVVGVHDDKSMSPSAARIDEAAAGALRRLLESGDISGKIGSTHLLFGLPGMAAPRLLVVGLGEPKKFDAARFARANGDAAKVLKGLPIASALSFLTEVDVPGRDLHWKLRTAALVSDHANYRYTATFKAKDKPKADTLAHLSLAGGIEGDAALIQASAIAAGVQCARELGNLPPNICNPAYLAREAQKFAAEIPGVGCEILEREQMAELGMGSLLGVAQGSANAPKLIVLRWNGGGEAKPYALVGKGITFDTGGISLKPGPGMEEMKFDMCGAAGMLGTFLAVAKLQLPLNIVCIVAAVENMPDGNAYRPGDVLTSMSGLTIEVLNTDAEGRLILCDALTYAQKFSPQVIIDAATLTGACVIALGKHASGLMTKDDELATQLLDAGNAALDRAWRLPLWDDYQNQLDSGFADVANIGGKNAGAITAGCFLARFTENQRWAHLDIAGTAWDEGRKGMATGRPVPLLVQYLLDRCA
ncbi:MAG: leucyl aminopeptidase [Tahibacter sp.]